MSGADRPIGVALLNLGGPAGEHDVERFIRALLSDPAVVAAPAPIRRILARVIARRRAPSVRAHYRAIGPGGSPLTELARAQAEAVAELLGTRFSVRHVFRHAPPGADEVVASWTAAGSSRVVALPAYPQWSGSTTGSAVADLARAAAGAGVELTEVAPYPDAAGFIDALWERTAPMLDRRQHVLMLAHGLPRRQVDRGDPYPTHVERTARALAACLPEGTAWSLAYQSRLGPISWTRPYSTDEVRRLAAAGVTALLVVPLSFACENLETLWELDRELADVAHACGITDYRRAPVPGAHPAFVRELADRARHAAESAGWV